MGVVHACMTTFVLVPGGWRGGWYFSGLADRLRTAGHRALTVTPTGVGDRAHLNSAGVNLDVVGGRHLGCLTLPSPVCG